MAAPELCAAFATHVCTGDCLIDKAFLRTVDAGEPFENVALSDVKRLKARFKMQRDVNEGTVPPHACLTPLFPPAVLTAEEEGERRLAWHEATSQDTLPSRECSFCGAWVAASAVVEYKQSALNVDMLQAAVEELHVGCG